MKFSDETVFYGVDLKVVDKNNNLTQNKHHKFYTFPY
jgi:hypothetical protein